MGGSWLFSFLMTAMQSGCPQISPLCCISTQLRDVLQRCSFSLTLPLPRFSFIIIIFYGLKCEQSPSTWNLPAASGVIWRPRSESQSSLKAKPPALLEVLSEGGALWAEVRLGGSRWQGKPTPQMPLDPQGLSNDQQTYRVLVSLPLFISLLVLCGV